MKTPASVKKRFVNIELPKTDRLFVYLIIGTFILSVFLISVFVLSDPTVKAYILEKFEYNKIIFRNIGILKVAFLMALTIVFLYSYQITKNPTFLYIGFMWFAHLTYKIIDLNLDNIISPKAKYTEGFTQVIKSFVGITAMVADLPIFLAAFPRPQKKWLPIIPIIILLFTVFIFSINLHRDVSDQYYLDKRVIQLIELISSIQPFIFLIIITHLIISKKIIFETSKKFALLLGFSFLMLAIVQIPFIFDGVSPPQPPLPSSPTVGFWSFFSVFVYLSFLISILFIIRDYSVSKDSEIKIKGEFEVLGYLAASIEHELRTPLRVAKIKIKDLLEQIRNDKHSFEQFNNKFQDLDNEFDKISDAANVINILRLKKERFERSLEETRVLDRINSAIKRLKVEYPLWSEKIAMGDVTEKTKELSIQAHYAYFEQSILNLLKNSYESIERKRNKIVSADKKHNKGKILIELDVGEDRNKVLITLRDDGEGFDLNDVERLTNPLYSKKDRNKQDNRGLGLFVCEKVVDLHGGKMQFSNYKDGGAEVRLEFPRNFTKRQIKEHIID